MDFPWGVFEKQIVMDKSLQTSIFCSKNAEILSDWNLNFVQIKYIWEENKPFVVDLYETISFSNSH